MASQFSNAGQPSDYVFVMVLVEDSRAMQAKWNDVRRHYLPLILESLRTVDMVEQMHIWWLTSSAASKPFTTSIQNAGYCHEIPEVKLGQQPDTAISTATIRRCLKIYANTGKQRYNNQHLIIVASSPLMSVNEGPGHMQTGIDPWLGTALALCQACIRLHLIVGPVFESRTFRDLFDRARYVQSLSEVSPWFAVDQSKFSVHLAGVSSQQASPPASTSPDTLSTASSPEIFTSSSLSLPPSPTHYVSSITSPRPSFSSSAGSRIEPLDIRPPELVSRTTADTLGIVSYLQRYHGLTKKRLNGGRGSKRAAAGDLRGIGPSRPILPRLDVPSVPYTLPTSPTHISVGAAAAENMVVSPTKRTSFMMDDRYSGSDRRPQTRDSSLPTSPQNMSDINPTSDSTAAALRSLESMTPRLTEFHTTSRPGMSATGRAQTGRPSSRSAELMHALAYHHAGSRNPVYAQTKLAGSPSALLTMNSVRPPHPLDRSYSYDGTPLPPSTSTPERQSMSYDSTPMVSQTSTPLPSPTATASTTPSDSVEDQPFIVTPEYEALVAARFAEAVRSGAMQASMTSSLSNALAFQQVPKTNHLQPDSYVSAHLPQQQATSPPISPAGYTPYQYFDLTSQTRTRTEWNGGQGYMQNTPSGSYGTSTSNWNSQ
ncbi:uncharacterized protein LAESUDRAFT_445158 [Laetiporus sulphureus 93-53]|uniref:Uncharacterized protein n=1 Tax=Laetiporus sulphureus 93-53 TaxID=1314785 RepID=A0A165C0W0_9APHY|nr:uncharacterized protein LAESUDRAFT_445158 [Laetiporus sulphureus 93-53]KZT01999.1 hypothetical protein LAESUDRAFT_445158 [Laetiporus sulphureus 93-53]